MGCPQIDVSLGGRNLEYCWEGGLRILSTSGGPSGTEPQKATCPKER